MTIGKWFKSEWWAEYALEILPTGSTVICDPPPHDTDVDYLLLLDKAAVAPLEEALKKDGFVMGGSMARRKPKYFFVEKGETRQGWKFYRNDGETDILIRDDTAPNPPLLEYPDWHAENLRSEEAGVFRSWKKEALNLILTCSPEYFENFAKATSLSKFLNLTNKEHRVGVFEAVCFDHWPYYNNKKDLSNDF